MHGRQITAEMARRLGLRPRTAWRHALGWPQWKLAQRYNLTEFVTHPAPTPPELAPGTTT